MTEDAKPIEEVLAELNEKFSQLASLVSGQMAELRRMHDAEKLRGDNLQAVLMQANEPAPEPTEAEKMAQLRPRLSNPVFLADGRVDCTFNHPTRGPIPFTADPNDVEEHGRLIHKILTTTTLAASAGKQRRK